MVFLRRARYVVSTVALLACTTCALAQSHTQHPQPQSDSSQQKTANGIRGTQQSPIVVEVLPAVQSPEEAARIATQREEEASSRQWDIRLTAAIAFFTLGLLIVGGLQIAALRRQNKIIETQSRLSQASLDMTRSIERPFLFVDVFDNHVLGDRFHIRPKWRNSGRTPAMRRKIWSNWKTFDNEPPSNWTWPDLDESGNTSTVPSGIGDVFVAPQGTVIGLSTMIPINTMEAVRMGHKRLYLYGWAEYDDTTATPSIRRRTEFCNEVAIVHWERDTANQVTIHVTFPQFGPYNRAT